MEQLVEFAASKNIDPKGPIDLVRYHVELVRKSNPVLARNLFENYDNLSILNSTYRKNKKNVIGHGFDVYLF